MLSLSTEGDDFQPCTSPVEYSDQARGKHTFKVRVSDDFGNTGPATSYEFNIGSNTIDAATGRGER